MSIVTKEQLTDALKKWEVARVGAAAQHEAWHQWLQAQKLLIEFEQERHKDSRLGEGFSYQTVNSKAAQKVAPFDAGAHLEAVNEMKACHEAFHELKAKFIEQSKFLG